MRSITNTIMLYTMNRSGLICLLMLTLFKISLHVSQQTEANCIGTYLKIFWQMSDIHLWHILLFRCQILRVRHWSQWRSNDTQHNKSIELMRFYGISSPEWWWRHIAAAGAHTFARISRARLGARARTDKLTNIFEAELLGQAKVNVSNCAPT